MASEKDSVAIALIGAGSGGVTDAYCFVRNHGFKRVVPADPLDPMSLMLARSGENSWNRWPCPLMTALTNDGIGGFISNQRLGQFVLKAIEAAA